MFNSSLYDEKMSKTLDVFTKEPHNMEYEEAIEFTDFNVVGLDGNGNWTIMYNREYYA